MITRDCFAARSAFVAMLSYLTVALTCAYADAKHLPPFSAQSLEAAAVTSETPGRGADEELCQFMHEQMLTKQAFSAGSITAAKISDVVLIGKEMLRRIGELNAFRPPGSWYAPAKQLSFRFHSVLRI